MSDDPFQSINSKTLQEDVTDIIRRAILRGDLLPGTRINQAQIAKKLGTSRGPVREALRQLEKERLIRDIPYKGSFVIEITPTYIEELYSIRRSLEGFAIRRAIERVQPEDLEAMRAVIAEMQQIVVLADLNRTVELDLKFHYLICKGAHHTLLMQLWRSIEASVRLCLTHRHRGYRDSHQVLDTHPEILAAIEAKDADRASRLLDSHIQEAGDAMYTGWVTSRGPDKSTSVKDNPIQKE